MNRQSFHGRCLSAFAAFFLAFVLGVPCSAGVVDFSEGDACSFELEESYLGGQAVAKKRSRKSASESRSLSPRQADFSQSQAIQPLNLYSEHAARNGIGGPLTI